MKEVIVEKVKKKRKKRKRERKYADFIFWAISAEKKQIEKYLA